MAYLQWLNHAPGPWVCEVKRRLLHTCDNRRCVKPDHLFVGTHQDNIDDAFKKGRLPVGERQWNSRLKAADVISIRRLAKEGVPRAHLEKKFGVKQRHIADIINLRRWAHLVGLKNG